MRLRNRFLLIGIGIIIFAVISPLLILFALGYKVDFAKRQLVKTGTLVVKSEPAKANILLNGKKVRATTPETVRFLVPQDYNVTIQKAGYQPWTKRLSVQSEIVSWANLDREFVTLFFEEPKSAKAYGIVDAYQSQDQNAAVFADDTSISLINADGRVSDLHNYNFYQSLKPLKLDPASMYSLLYEDRAIALSPEKWATVIRAEADSDFTTVQTAAAVEVYNAKSEMILSFNPASAFHLDGNILWLVQNRTLTQIDLRNAASSIISSDFSGADFKVIRGDNNTFLISDKNLYIKNDKLEKIYDNATYAYWSEEAHYLVYANGHEIFLFDPGTQRSSLLLRSSSVLGSPVVNRLDGYVFFMNEGKIKAIEIDGRDHRNIYNIADEGNSFYVTDDGRTLIVAGATKLEELEIR